MRSANAKLSKLFYACIYLMLPEIKKLYPDNPEPGVEEFKNIISGKSFILEQIKSFGEVSEEGFWFDQRKKEWAALIQGEVTLEFEDGVLELVAGDALIFEPHQKHRITKSSVNAVWLALHFENDESQIQPIAGSAGTR